MEKDFSENSGREKTSEQESLKQKIKDRTEKEYKIFSDGMDHWSEVQWKFESCVKPKLEIIFGIINKDNINAKERNILINILKEDYGSCDDDYYSLELQQEILQKIEPNINIEEIKTKGAIEKFLERYDKKANDL